MSKADDKVKTPPTKGSSGKDANREGWFIALQLLDTTWRVALPILLLSFIGAKLDKHYGTMPRYTLIGFFVSLALSTTLVYKQIKNLYPDFFKGDKK